MGGPPYIVGIVEIERHIYCERNCCWRSALSEILGSDQSLKVWESLLYWAYAKIMGRAFPIAGSYVTDRMGVADDRQ